MGSLAGRGWSVTAEDPAGFSPYLRARLCRFGAYAIDGLGIDSEVFEVALVEIDVTVLDLAVGVLCCFSPPVLVVMFLARGLGVVPLLVHRVLPAHER